MVGGSETHSLQPPETLTSSIGEGKLHSTLEQVTNLEMVTFGLMRFYPIIIIIKNSKVEEQ